ncbi:WXG100 family type VII secretion target [Streptomyces mirabilis]|uniref:WXG100 family type VII secretion target n=1 Tax=Streptomyces mirabilis TaxID=68239 RepID=UPI00332E1A09
MGVTDASADEGGGPDLRVSSKGLTKLAGDLGDMQDHLDKQVKRMDAIIDRIEAGWRGPAATAYREFHRAATEDAVRAHPGGHQQRSRQALHAEPGDRDGRCSVTTAQQPRLLLT